MVYIVYIAVRVNNKVNIMIYFTLSLLLLLVRIDPLLFSDFHKTRKLYEKYITYP